MWKWKAQRMTGTSDHVTSTAVYLSLTPLQVKDAECLEVMSYNEAWELAYFGANVLHPRTTLPAMRYRIPVVLRNVFNRQHKGTTITTKEEAAGRGPKVRWAGGLKERAEGVCWGGGATTTVLGPITTHQPQHLMSNS